MEINWSETLKKMALNSIEQLVVWGIILMILWTIASIFA